MCTHQHGQVGLFMGRALLRCRFKWGHCLTRGNHWQAFWQLGSTHAELQPVVARQFLPKVNTVQSMKASSLVLLGSARLDKKHFCPLPGRLHLTPRLES
jgi:hypothetical protein